MERFLSPKIVVPVFIVLLSIPLTIYVVGQQQRLDQFAWSTSQSATAKCDDAIAVIDATFTNTEPNKPSTAMTVTVKDMQSGKTANMGSISGGQSETVRINTGKTSLQTGVVVFSLKWTDGHSGTDSRNASYPAVQTCTGPTPTKTPTPTPPGVGKCPDGTELLFAKSGTLSKGQSVAAGGTISALNGSWRVESQNNVLLTVGGSTITVTFPNQVLLHSALIYDNDPKSGESPWSINGKSLPTTKDNTWGPVFALSQTTKTMAFDNGGDSPHFNVCVKKESATPTPTKKPSPTPTKKVTPTPTKKVTPTPTKKITPTPTPKITKTPTPKPSKSPTPEPSLTPELSTTPEPTPTIPACVAPKPVKNIKVTCPYCE